MIDPKLKKGHFACQHYVHTQIHNILLLTMYLDLSMGVSKYVKSLLLLNLQEGNCTWRKGM